MSKVAHYLQQHILGEVIVTPDARKYFSVDNSVFTVTPTAIIYPRNENDIRKTARFSWQLAERGRVLPITARGMGTDQAGAAIGSGLLLIFPAHMNRILELDGKTGVVIVEPGTNYGKLQQTLQTHGRFLPPYPASLEYSTIGGAIANNASGEKSVKYGSTRSFVKQLRVVLANGEVVETKRLSKRELSRKLGLTTFEGEIYRSLDTLLEENSALIKGFKLNVSKNVAGYDIFDIKRKDGSFDLTPLIVGSQGTLGIVTEATLETAGYNPETTLVAALFDDLQVADHVLQEIRKMPEGPSTIELVDDNLLNFTHEHNPSRLGNDVIKPPFPKLMAFIELDNANIRTQKRLAKKVTKILDHYQVSSIVETEELQKEKLRKIRDVSTTMITHSEGNAKALPIIEDGVVPLERFGEYLSALYLMFERYKLRPAVWGHGGDANVHIQTILDLSQVGDRQKAFKLMDEYYDLIISFGGTTTGEHGDGRLRAPYLKKLYGEDIYDLFEKVKQIFDPYGTLNPGVKTGVTSEDIKPLLRYEYSVGLADHLPRS